MANISFVFNSLLICTLPDTSKFASAKEISLLMTTCSLITLTGVTSKPIDAPSESVVSVCTAPLLIDNFVLFPSSPIKLIEPVLKYKSRNGYSALPISYVNAIVGTIPPDTVITLFTKIPLLNDTSPSTFKSPFKDASLFMITLLFAVNEFSNVALPLT